MALSNRSLGRGYEPLVITASLRCGIVSDGLLPLDAVLYYAQHRETLASQPRITTPRARVARDPAGPEVPKLPLQILDGDSQHWYYAASCAVWPALVADGVDYWTKRIDTQYLDVLEVPRARIPLSGGAYRGYRMPLAYRHALSVRWYAVGHLAQIRELLALVSHLGKKTGMGWGAVAEWTVEAHAEDWSVTGPEGRLMRTVPDPNGLVYGYRPPYWLPRHQTACRLPIAS